MEQREKIRKRIEKLALSKANDVVRLAILGEGALPELDQMELSAVTEFKRGSNGTVEVKFLDRLGALRWLWETETGDRALSVFGSLEKGAGELREEE